MKRFILVCLVGCSDEPTSSDGGPDGNAADGTSLDGNRPDAESGAEDAGTMESGMPEGGYALTCPSYCAGMMSVCAGAMNGQYLDMATCLAMCAKLVVGDAGAMMGNTLACRIYHLGIASLAPASADSHCPHAGPFGFAYCGTECESFCALFDAQCGAGNFGDGGCAAGCPTIPNPANTTTSFLSGSGNTLDCREYHLENAYQANDTNGAGHCAHATLGGGGVCQ